MIAALCRFSADCRPETGECRGAWNDGTPEHDAWSQDPGRDVSLCPPPGYLRTMPETCTIEGSALVDDGAALWTNGPIGPFADTARWAFFSSDDLNSRADAERMARTLADHGWVIVECGSEGDIDDKPPAADGPFFVQAARSPQWLDLSIWHGGIL